MTRDASNLLFVYGSLTTAAPHPNGERLRAEAALLGAATFQGQLYKVSWYPAAIASADPADLVHGEVYHLKDAEHTLDWLDQYEGIKAGPVRPAAASDEYVRAEHPVQMTSGEILRVQIYLYTRPVAGLTRVQDGKWRALL
jgi:gamma-glutamylcyclotransferase (GGCT)/AIG2-like uncharacterized protein YtfP